MNKNMNRIYGTVFLLLFFSVQNGFAEGPALEKIISSIFLGQAYEPTKIYLLGVQKGQKNPSWPKKLEIRSMDSAIKAPVRAIQFVEEVNPLGKQNQNEEESADSAGQEASLPHLKLDGFFETVSDMDIADVSMGHYTSQDKRLTPSQVVAFDSSIKLGELDFSAAGKNRPLTADEEKVVKEDRAKYQEPSMADTCTTEPGFLDEALEMWTAKLSDQNLSIRVSQYSDPGCGGHLSNIYVIDILSDGKIKKTAEIYHYFGAI